MNTLKNILGLTFIAALTFTGCSSDDDNNGNEDPIVETPQPDGEALQQTFLDNRDEAVQTGIIDAETGGSIYGEQGTEIVFSANSFAQTRRTNC